VLHLTSEHTLLRAEERSIELDAGLWLYVLGFVTLVSIVTMYPILNKVLSVKKGRNH
jgi:hypothetical protein